MRYAKSLRLLLSSLCTAAIACNYLLAPAWVGATIVQGGQLSSARQVTINGSNAIVGQTVFSGSRIKVGDKGSAIINLGRLGRIELGPNSDFVLRVTDDKIGGELNSGCLTASAPAGVKIEIATAKGTVNADGKSPSSLMVGLKDGNANIIPTLGALKVATATKSETAAVGEFLKLTSDSRNGDQLLRRPATACEGSGGLCSCSTSSPTVAGKGAATGLAVLPVLLIAAAGGTAALALGLIDSGGGGGLTCIGSNCRPISPTTP